MRWAPIREEFEARWHAGERPVDIRRAFNLTHGQMAGATIRFNLHRLNGNGATLRPGHPALIEGRSAFPHRVAAGLTHLRPGYHSSKLGRRVLKGRWKGMPIYALTLEERKTCPRTCALWAACYGNNMQWAKRSPHGPEFELALWRELHALNRRHRNGFVVRLHVLGDFYNVSYVGLWHAALDWFENLHVFGYTAWPTSTEIGHYVQHLRSTRWDRFSVRTSGAEKGLRTSVFERAEDVALGTIICPAQTGKTKSCGSCGLCWNSKRPIAFLRH
jgi:hypothetical protein